MKRQLILTVKNYSLIFRNGFRIVKRHIWIFLIPFLVSAFNIIYHTSFTHWYLVVKQQGVVSSFVQRLRYFPSHLSSIFLHGLPHLILDSFSYFQPHIRYGGVTTLILALVVLIGYKQIKRYLRYKKKESELKILVSFIEKILLASAIIGIGLLLFDLGFWLWRPTSIPPNQPLISIFLLLSVFHGLATYWYTAILVTLLTSGILIVVNRALVNKGIIKAEVTSEILRCFKPLFLFCLILGGIYSFPFMIVSSLATITQNEAIKETYQHLGIALNQFISPVIFLAAVFTPYVIVKEKSTLKAAFKANFTLWKRHFAEIAIFVLFGIGVLLIPLLVDESAGFSFRFSSPLILSLLVGIITTGLKVFANLIVVAALVIFYSSLTSKEKISSDTVEI